MSNPVIELACCETVLLNEIGMKEATPEFIRTTYDLALRSSDHADGRIDWEKVHAAIIARWDRDTLCDLQVELRRKFKRSDLPPIPPVPPKPPHPEAFTEVITATVSLKQLRAAFEAVYPLTPKKHPCNACECVKVAFEPTLIEIITWDQECSASSWAPASCEGIATNARAACIVPAKKLRRILKALPQDEITIKAMPDKFGNNLAFYVEGGHIEIPCEDLDDFSEIKAETNEGEIHFHPSELCESLEMTLFATDAESSRYSLGGVCLHRTGEGIDIIGTDARRLSVSSLPVSPLKWDCTEAVVLNARVGNFLQERLQAFDDETEIVTVSVGATHIRIQHAKLTVIAERLSGRYPRYEDVIRKKSKHTTQVPVERMRDVLWLARTLSGETKRSVMLQLKAGELHAVIKTEEGVCVMTTPIEFSGPELEVYLDPRLVGEYFERLPNSAQVSLEMKSGAEAVNFVTGRHLFVAMPMTSER